MVAPVASTFVFLFGVSLVGVVKDVESPAAAAASTDEVTESISSNPIWTFPLAPMSCFLSRQRL